MLWERRLKLLAGFSTLQAAIQLVAGLSGLLLVRVLDKREFGAYAIATSLFTTLNVLTDCGVGTGLTSIGRRVWRDRSAMSRLVATTLSVRAQLAIGGLPLGVGFSLLLFRQNAVPWSESIALALAVVSAFWGLVNTHAYTIALRLRGSYLKVQRLELLTATVRLAILATIVFLFSNAILAIAAAASSVSLEAILLRQQAKLTLDPDAPVDLGHRSELIHFLKKQWFSSIFFAFQGQITIWLIALFGTPEKVAEVGALGRLAAVFAFITSLTHGIAVPALARCSSIDRLRRLFGLMLLSYLLFSCTMLVAGLGFSHQMLWLLGRQYAGLAGELPLVIATSIIWGLTGVLYALASARGWIWQAWLSPLMTIALQLALLRWLDLTQVRGVLVLSLFSSLPVLFSVTYMVARGLGAGRWEVSNYGSR